MKSKYSAEEKFQIVMESFTDNVTQAEICRRHGIYPVQLIKWREQCYGSGYVQTTRGWRNTYIGGESREGEFLISSQFQR